MLEKATYGQSIDGGKCYWCDLPAFSYQGSGHNYCTGKSYAMFGCSRYPACKEESERRRQAEIKKEQEREAASRPPSPDEVYLPLVESSGWLFPAD